MGKPIALVVKHNNISVGTRTFNLDTRGAELVPELHILLDDGILRQKGLHRRST